MTTTDTPHVMVTWANAITTGQRVSECFGSRDDAVAAAADRTREQWNNTRVTLCWHEAHGRAEARSARNAAHSRKHVWGYICRECDEIIEDRSASAAVTKAARDAAGDVNLHVVTS